VLSERLSHLFATGYLFERPWRLFGAGHGSRHKKRCN
jgi:hypothetical protein